MKKVILWASVTVLVIVLSVVFFAYRGKQDPEADVPVRKQKVQQATSNDVIDLGSQTYEILEMELNDRFNTHFPDLVGKELNPQIPLETDESGKITNGVKILAVHLIFTNKDAQDPDALCNGFQLVDPNNLESGFLREMDINDFREDPVNHEYFHTKLKQGESKEIWVGFFVTDDEIKNRKAALYFNLTEGDENNRQIPLDFTKIKKTY